ncbi:hypothetical protein NTGBS_690029 [Candidatus Nitrotoga sp. BS]|nr:hypothetical protein NTGBS_690029 [Candidatus Nitrotoga sp. BS]
MCKISIKILEVQYIEFCDDWFDMLSVGLILYSFIPPLNQKKYYFVSMCTT